MTLALVPAVGIAALWLWYAAQLPTPLLHRVVDLARRNGTAAHLIACPWCLGAWLALGLTIAAHARLGLLDPVLTPLAWLAAAGITGLLSLLIPDSGEVV